MNSRFATSIVLDPLGSRIFRPRRTQRVFDQQGFRRKLYPKTRRRICVCHVNCLALVRETGTSSARLSECISGTERVITSGVPYAMLLRKGLFVAASYFSAKPKSTRTGTRFSEIMMFAGLKVVRSVMSLAWMCETLT